MHAALEAQGPARPAQATRSPDAGTHTPRRSLVETGPWVVALLVVVGLSMADSLLAGVVPYERDTTVFYFPLMSWLGQQLQHGQLPLWTPQFFGGYPIFADGEIRCCSRC